MSSALSALVQPNGITRHGSVARVGAVVLPALLLAALLARAAAFWTQTYVVFPDETFQYFEQGHRLAFGAAVVPWEFHDGIRSWLLPGLIAAVMRLAAAFADDPLLYVRLTRLGCAVLSLAVVFVGFRLAERREGLAGAVLAGGFCAAWFDLIYFAPAVMTEILAAHLALLAVWYGEETDSAPERRLALSGALLGLAFCLRFQYAPALLAAALWQHRLCWARWRPVLVGGATLVLLVGGVLDTLTWGAPFQSLWLNVVRNTLQGVSAAIGTESSLFYGAYLLTAFWPAPVLAPLAVIGAMRAPALGLMAAVTLVEHTLVPHKEVRFVYLVIAATSILIGLGAAHLARMLAERMRIPGWCLPVALLPVAALSWRNATTAPLAARWAFERANVQAFLAAHRQPSLCGLGVKDVRYFDSGGYTYLHRAVPVYFARLDPVLVLPGTSVPLRTTVVLDGKPVPQFPGAALADAAGRYNHLVAEAGNAPGGFAPVACFDDATRAGQPPLCLFARPSGCS